MTASASNIDPIHAAKARLKRKIKYYKMIKLFLTERHHLYPNETVEDVIAFCQGAVNNLKEQRKEIGIGGDAIQKVVDQAVKSSVTVASRTIEIEG